MSDDYSYGAPHRRKTDAELLAIPGEHFPFGLSEVDQDRWLRLVPEDRLYAARDIGLVLQSDRRVIDRVLAAIDRLPIEKSLMAVQAVVPKKRPWLAQHWQWVVGVLVAVIGILLRLFWPEPRPATPALSEPGLIQSAPLPTTKTNPQN